MECGFKSVHTLLDIDEFILIHDPVYWYLAKDRIWLCGHIHNLFKRIGNVLNVGVDVHEYYPISIEEVRKEFEIDEGKYERFVVDG